MLFIILKKCSIFLSGNALQWIVLFVLIYPTYFNLDFKIVYLT